MAFDGDSIKAFVRTYLSANFEETLGSVLSSLKLGGSVAFSVLGNAMLIPVVLFYLLMEWHGIVKQVQMLVPPRLPAFTAPAG